PYSRTWMRRRLHPGLTEPKRHAVAIRRAPAVVLPAPSRDPASRTFLEVDREAARGADGVGVAVWRDLVLEWQKDRVVRPVVSVGLQPDPELVGLRGIGGEGDVDVLRRIGGRP